jgi:hypothetical protein
MMLSAAAGLTAAETKECADKLVDTRSQTSSKSTKEDMKKEMVPREGGHASQRGRESTNKQQSSSTIRSGIPPATAESGSQTCNKHDSEMQSLSLTPMSSGVEFNLPAQILPNTLKWQEDVVVPEHFSTDEILGLKKWMHQSPGRAHWLGVHFLRVEWVAYAPCD